MCDNPFCGMPPPMGLMNMAANHVEKTFNVTISQGARALLGATIPADDQTLQTYLAGNGLSHLDLVHLAEKQFVQGLAHLPPTPAAPAPGGAHRVMDAQAVKAGIGQKAWSDLWQAPN